MAQLLQIIPNFSEGRDRSFVDQLVDLFTHAGGVVLDAHLDPDHHRSVVTVIGPPASVVRGAVAAAALARDRIDLRGHRGVHPRIGALDVLPLVPVAGMTWAETVALARDVGARIAKLGIPSFLYGRASVPPGRQLSELRRGGFEALSKGGPEVLAADFAGDAEAAGLGRGSPCRVHPTAGATCVGVRRVLLAWNVDVAGIPHEMLVDIAHRLRESQGGFPGLRTLALTLPLQSRTQISMNLEDPGSTDPLDVFLALEKEVLCHHGEVVETEIIGMLPDALAAPETWERIKLRGRGEHRVLSRRVNDYLSEEGRPVGKTIER